MKSNEADIELGKGLAIGSVLPAHNKLEHRDAKTAEGVVEKCLKQQIGDNIRRPDEGCPCGE
jgi:hypothetical protein